MYPDDCDVRDISSSSSPTKHQAGSSSWFPSSSSSPFKYSTVKDDELKYNHHGKNRFYSMRDVLYWRILPCLILMVLPWIPLQMTRSTVLSKQKTIQSMMDEQKELVAQLDETTEKIRSLEKDVVILTKDNELNFQELDRSGKLLKTQELQNKEGYEEQEKEEQALVKRIDDLEKAVKASATRRLEQRYVLV
jgi:hypothetical protein